MCVPLRQLSTFCVRNCRLFAREARQRSSELRNVSSRTDRGLSKKRKTEESIKLSKEQLFLRLKMFSLIPELLRLTSEQNGGQGREEVNQLATLFRQGSLARAVFCPLVRGAPPPPMLNEEESLAHAIVVREVSVGDCSRCINATAAKRPWTTEKRTLSPLPRQQASSDCC